MFDGRGSEWRREAQMRCERCETTGQVHYTGSDVLHGNPFSPAADTEVEHHYECAACQHRWSRLC